MQQINLYVPELRPKKEWMTAKTLLTLVVGFSVLMLFSVLINRHQLSNYQLQVERLEHQKLLGERSLAEIKSKNPSQVGAKLDLEVQDLRARVHQRIQVSDLIGRQNLGNNRGYSQRMTALANEVPDSMSLYQFRFSQGEAFVEMQGESKQAAPIVEIVSELKQGAEFGSAIFGTLSIHEQSQKNRFRFSYGFDPLFESDKKIAEKTR